MRIYKSENPIAFAREARRISPPLSQAEIESMTFIDLTPAPRPQKSEVQHHSELARPAEPAPNESRLQELGAFADFLVRKLLHVVLLDESGAILQTEDSWGNKVDSFTTNAVMRVRCTPGVTSLGIVTEAVVRVQGPLREDQRPRYGKTLFPETTMLVHADDEVTTRLYLCPAQLLGTGPRRATFEEWTLDANCAPFIEVFGADIRFPRQDAPFSPCPTFVTETLLNGAQS